MPSFGWSCPRSRRVTEAGSGQSMDGTRAHGRARWFGPEASPSLCPPSPALPFCRHREEHHGREWPSPSGTEGRQELQGEHLLRGLPARPGGTQRRVCLCPPRAAAPASCLLSQQEQLWAVCSGHDDVYIWDLKDLAQPLGKVHLPDCHQVNCMIRVKRQVRRGACPHRDCGEGVNGGALPPSGESSTHRTRTGAPSWAGLCADARFSGRSGWVARGCRRGHPKGKST